MLTFAAFCFFVAFWGSALGFAIADGMIRYTAGSRVRVLDIGRLAISWRWTEKRRPV